MTTYSYGDYVAYRRGKSVEFGRVTEDRGTNVFVCYSSGCTAASTPKGLLRPATITEIETIPSTIGFNRFNPECNKMDPECCYMCVHYKKDKNEARTIL